MKTKQQPKEFRKQLEVVYDQKIAFKITIIYWPNALNQRKILKEKLTETSINPKIQQGHLVQEHMNKKRFFDNSETNWFQTIRQDIIGRQKPVI